MKATDGQLPAAPKRGQYDRALSRGERQAAQRERVMLALISLSATQRELNLANVVEAAGIGRNTFYEYFDDIDHALLALKSRAVRELATRIDAELHEARTPHERVRGLARAWALNLSESRTLSTLALRAQSEAIEPTQLSALGQHLVSVLAGEFGAQAALPGISEPLRRIMVATLFDAVSRAHLNSQPMTLEALQSTLADLALRLLR